MVEKFIIHMNSYSTRASEEEIFARLVQIVEPGAKDIVLRASQIIEKQNSKAMLILYEYDASLGGMGIYQFTEKRHLGAYRSLFYVKLSLASPYVKELTRYAVHSACAYIEALLKKVVHTWPWEEIGPENYPLGTLIHRYKRHLPPELLDNLLWLTKSVYNFAKHYNNFENDENDPENYFSIKEAIAVYFICRKLGLELEKLMGKSQEELEWD